MKILLVEDNPLTAKGLYYLLEKEGYSVDLASSLAEAEANLAKPNYQLVILDVSLPDGEGFDLARQLRAWPNLPIIFLTARDDEADVIRGLELGAEDYITKPFRNRELLLRIKKALRQNLTDDKVLSAGHFSLNLTNHELTYDGKLLILTAVERQLLIYLMENAGHIVTREQLLDEIYQMSGKIVNDNTLSVYLKRLRQKINHPKAIETVKNLGYRLNTEQ